MSETIDDLEVEYPKTVTACHAEIDRLAGKINSLDSKNSDLAGKLYTAEERFEERFEERLVEIEGEGAATELGAVEAINRFLDECVRVAPLKYDVPQTDRAMQTIVALHDAVGRNP